MFTITIGQLFLIFVVGVLLGFWLRKQDYKYTYEINDNLVKQNKELFEEKALTEIMCKVQANTIKEQERKLQLQREGIFKCQR